MLALVIIIVFAGATILYITRLKSKKAELENKLKELGHTKKQEILKNIKDKRKQLLEKYRDKTIIAKLSIEEHYEEIKKLCREAGQIVDELEKLNGLRIDLSKKANLPEEGFDWLLKNLEGKESVYIFKQTIEDAIKYIHEVTDNCIDNEKLRDILLQSKQKLYDLEEAHKRITHCCYSFVGEDHNDKNRCYIYVDCFNKDYTDDRPTRYFVERAGLKADYLDSTLDYNFMIKEDIIKISLNTTFLSTNTRIEMGKIINYLQKP